MKQVWVLLDDAAGHMNQVLGVAEALHLPYEAKTIKYNRLSELPNILLYASLWGVSAKTAAEIKAPWPDIVIAAGRKTAPVAAYIKRQSKGRAKWVQIMHPGFPAWGVDLMVLPEHDGHKAEKNAMLTLGAPNRVQADFLAQEAAIWKRTLEVFTAPKVAVLLGGDTQNIRFSAKDGEKLAQKIGLLTQYQGSLLISSSRRTPPEFSSALLEHLKQQFYFHDPKKSRTNPYYAFLAEAEAIVVTADSVSMLSEACSAGKPVYVYVPEHFAAKKHQKLLHTLLEKGYALSFGQAAPHKNGPRLNAAEEVARRVLEIV